VQATHPSEPMVLAPATLSLRAAHIQSVEKDVAAVSVDERDSGNEENVSRLRQDIDIMNDRYRI